MKKVLRLLIMSIMILIIICCVLIYKLKDRQKVDNNNIIIQNEVIDDLENNVQDNNTKDNVLTKTVNDSNYYTIINCINDFLTNVRKKEINIIIDILDKNYVQSENISEENINQYIQYMGEYQKLYVYEMYEENINNETTKFYIKGKLAIGYNKEKNIDVCFIVLIDYNNFIFSIIPCYEGQVEIFDVQNIKEKYINKAIQIEKNDNNNLNIKQTTDDYMAREYFYNYQYMIIHDYKNFYNRIDENYKKKRFSTKDNYIQYIKDNINHLENLTLKEYSVDKTDGYIQYICLDNYNNYYTIEVNSVMDYTIILDDYTIETDKYRDLYNNSGDQQKVYNNIEKFIKMLNNRDYNAAYDVLDKEFKEKNFKQVKLFKEYIQKCFFDFINIENISGFKQSGKYYICNVEMVTGTSLSAERDTKTFIVELTEGTNFIMSFNID